MSHYECKECLKPMHHCDCTAKGVARFYSEQNQPEKKGALDTQVGGSHYKDFKIQPLEFTMENNLDFIQGNIIKYACRHKSKNGVEDLKKVIHYAQLAAKLQYNVEL